MKSYRYFGNEMEVLGSRLDAARKSLSGAKSAWAKNYWQQAVDRLLFQWRQLPILHDGNASVTIIPKWSIHYDFYEKSGEVSTYGIADRFYDAVFNHKADLSASWEAHRANRLMKAQ